MRIIKHSELKDRESTAYQNLWATDNTEFRGPFIALLVHIRKQERWEINELSNLKNARKRTTEKC